MASLAPSARLDRRVPTTPPMTVTRWTALLAPAAVPISGQDLEGWKRTMREDEVRIWEGKEIGYLKV